MFARYLTSLPGYLRRPVTPEQARARLADRLARRDASFLSVLARGVYANSASPYRRLLQHAGVEYGDIARLVVREGIEKTLETLYDAGVRLSMDEFKGRRPIERPGLQLATRPSDFDNPLLAHHYEARTSGSRGAASRVVIDLDLLAHDACYLSQYCESFNLEDRPLALWRPVPPVSCGANWALRLLKIGRPPARWFSPQPIRWSSGSWKFAVFTQCTWLLARWFAQRPLPYPAHVPASELHQVLDWLAGMKRLGTPAVMTTTPSSGVRLCLAALQQGVDIAGTVFWFGGEPYTPAKDEVVCRAGCTGYSQYSLSETGNIGLPCGERRQLDDVHLMVEKLAVIERQVRTPGQPVNALVFSTILPNCPKLMLNVESGDFGLLERRRCGCLLGRLGFDLHLSHIRSYEKLTSEGVTFLGTELLKLVEVTLPRRFGGSAIDYQIIEEERGGLPRISVLASPRLGPLDQQQVLQVVHESLGQVPGGTLMLDHWRQAQTLRVVRQEPLATHSAKVLPLVVRRAA